MPPRSSSLSSPRSSRPPDLERGEPMSTSEKWSRPTNRSAGSCGPRPNDNGAGRRSGAAGRCLGGVDDGGGSAHLLRTRRPHRPAAGQRLRDALQSGRNPACRRRGNRLLAISRALLSFSWSAAELQRCATADACRRTLQPLERGSLRRFRHDGWGLGGEWAQAFSASARLGTGRVRGCATALSTGRSIGTTVRKSTLQPREVTCGPRSARGY
jgi:hypothetical protein